MNVREGLRISGKIKIDTYRVGFVEAINPFLDHLQGYRKFQQDFPNSHVEATTQRIRELRDIIGAIKSHYFLRTAVECPNLIMDSAGFGLDLIIQRLVGINTYSLNILYGGIGTGATAPALTDMALTAPTNRASVGFQQDYGSTDAILQFFFSDSQLANQTYNEFGTFVDGTTTIGSGQLFNHALLSPGYAKIAGQDTSIQVDIAIANS